MLKRLRVVLALALVLSLLAGCSAKRAGSFKPDPNVDKSKLSKTLNLFNWSEYIPESVLTDFEKAYGVKVNYDTYSSNEEMAAKLLAGGSAYDVVVPSTYMVESLRKQGLLQELNHTLLPNLKHVDTEWRNLGHDPGNKFSVPYMWGTVGIAYNTKHVKTPPRNWEDLLDPAYKGRIVMLDDSREVLGIGLQALGHSLNETDPAKIKAEQDWLKRLIPSVKAWDSDNPKAMLISGEVWLGVVWNGEAALAIQENKDIRYAIPLNGGSVWMDNMVIPKNSKNVYTAHVFIDFILRPEVAAVIGEEFPYGLPNTEGFKLLPKKTRENVASYPPKDWLAKAEFMKDIGEATAQFERAFTELKAGR